MVELDRMARTTTKDTKDGRCQVCITMAGRSAENIDTEACRRVKVKRLDPGTICKEGSGVVESTGCGIEEVIPECCGYGEFTI